MEQGRVTQLVAETPNMWIHTKVNAEGGENEIHKHFDEDHAFIVLEGQMSVFDEKGGEIEVKQYQGVMIPKGAYYRYLEYRRRQSGRDPRRRRRKGTTAGGPGNAPRRRRQTTGQRHTGEPQQTAHRDDRQVFCRSRGLSALLRGKFLSKAKGRSH